MTDRRELRTWAAIDLDALAHNYRALRALLPESCRLLAPVKANGYGHGAVPVAKKLEALGVDMLSVACVDEGIELRRAGVSTPILCMGVTPAQLAGELLDFDITQTVEDLPAGEALSREAVRLGKTLRVHLKVDTGMGRLGVYWGDGDNSAAARTLIRLCELPVWRWRGCSLTSAWPTATRTILWGSCAASWRPGPPWRRRGSD